MRSRASSTSRPSPGRRPARGRRPGRLAARTHGRSERRGRLRAGTDPASALSALVVLLCAALTGGWWLWLVGSTVATTVVAQRAAPRVPHFLLPPRILRVALGLAVGTSLGSLIVTPSVASPVDGDRRPGPVPVLPGALVGLRVPDRVVGCARPARHPRPAPRRV